MKVLNKLKQKAKSIKKQLVILHLAYNHPKTPWTAKVLTVLIIGYALSPIDLIPDFIPIIGLLDDVILLPLGIYVVIKLIPDAVIQECTIEAESYKWNKKRNLIAGFIIGFIWLIIMCWVGYVLYNKYN